MSAHPFIQNLQRKQKAFGADIFQDFNEGEKLTVQALNSPIKILNNHHRKRSSQSAVKDKLKGPYKGFDKFVDRQSL